MIESKNAMLKEREERIRLLEEDLKEKEVMRMKEMDLLINLRSGFWLVLLRHLLSFYFVVKELSFTNICFKERLLSLKVFCTKLLGNFLYRFRTCHEEMYLATYY